MSIRSFLSVTITGLVVLLLWDRCVFRFERPESLFSICLLGVSAWATLADIFSGASQSQVTDLLLRGIMIECVGWARAESLLVALRAAP